MTKMVFDELDYLENILVEAQSHRPERQEYANGEFAWNTYEKSVMLSEVNKMRHAMGKLPNVTPRDIDSADASASGHFDYTHKFALGCRDLVWRD